MDRFKKHACSFSLKNANKKTTLKVNKYLARKKLQIKMERPSDPRDKLPC
jgi:hypothetical protein